MLTQGDSITEIGVNLQPPPGAQVIDGTNKTLIPGLLDAHTHTMTINEQREALLFGVTTELGMFDNAALLTYQACSAPVTDRADLFSASILATAPGGHGTQFGIPIPTLTAPSQAAGFVDDRIAEGAYHIKIVIEDLSLFQATPVSTLNLDIFTALVNSAHARGRLAISHVTKMSDAEMAIQNDADGLAHMPVDEVATAQFGRLVNRKGAFIVPTLVFMHGADGASLGAEPLADPNLSPWITPGAAANLTASFAPDFADRWSFQKVIESTQILNEQEVSILAGSDSGNPTTAHGASLHREMELLVYAGLTPVDALRSATSRPAQHFRLQDRGYIRPGKLADMVLVNGDPTTNILATRNIAAIFRRGALVDRSQLFQLASQPPTVPTCP